MIHPKKKLYLIEFHFYGMAELNCCKHIDVKLKLKNEGTKAIYGQREIRWNSNFILQGKRHVNTTPIHCG